MKMNNNAFYVYYHPIKDVIHVIDLNLFDICAVERWGYEYLGEL